MKDNRGGTRPHSGKKTELDGQPTRRVQVTLDARTLERLAVLGGGNVSKGIREAARTRTSNNPPKACVLEGPADAP